MRFVTGGMDGKAKIWMESKNGFQMVAELQGANKQAHDDWVRGVSWCTNIGCMNDMIATVGED